MSETAAARHILAPYCKGLGLDLGFGGDKVVPEALSFDLHQKYTHVGGDAQILQGDCRNLSFICDGVLDYCYSSHLLEDLWFHELKQTLAEWRRVLKPGGLLITLCPDQQVYSFHCQRTGQPYNEAHKEPTFSLSTFTEVARSVGNWETVLEIPLFNTYSFVSILRKA
jgi:predicted SAM-dependent methyltransferase